MNSRPRRLSARPPPTIHAANLATPEARLTVMTVLRRHDVAPEDLHELTDQVLAQALVLDRTPPTLVGCIELLRKMARRAALDERRLQQSGRRRVGARTMPISEPPPPMASGGTDARIALVPSEMDDVTIRAEMDITIRDTSRLEVTVKRRSFVRSPHRSELVAMLAVALAALAVVGCAGAWWLH